jgi:hypothetical protein
MSKKLEALLRLIESLQNIALKLRRNPNMSINEFNYYCQVMEGLNNEIAGLIDLLQK